MSTTDTTKLKQINVIKGGVTSSLGILKVGANIVWRRSQTITFSASTYGSWASSTLTIPFGATYSTSGNTITFKIGDTVVGTNTLTMPDNTTATANSTTGYSYNYSIDNTSGTVSNDFTITSTGSRADSTYWVTFAVNSSEYGSLSSYGAAIPANATVSVSGSILRFNGTDYCTPSSASNSSHSSTEYKNSNYSKRTVNWTRVYSVGSWSKTSGTIASPQTITHNFNYNDGAYSYGTWYHHITLSNPGSFTVSNTYHGSTVSTSTLGGIKIINSGGSMLLDRLTSGSSSQWIAEGTYYLQAYTANDYVSGIKPSVGFKQDSSSTINTISGPVQTDVTADWRGNYTITINEPHTYTLCGGGSGGTFSWTTASGSSGKTKGTSYSISWGKTLKNVVGFAYVNASWGSMAGTFYCYNGSGASGTTGKPGGWYGTITPTGYSTSSLSISFAKSSGTQVSGYSTSVSATFNIFCP